MECARSETNERTNEMMNDVSTDPWPRFSPRPQTRRRRYFENKQDVLKRKQSTPRNKKGGKPKTAAQALAEKEAAALNPQGQRGPGGRRNFNN
jgi:hypothetical protein